MKSNVPRGNVQRAALLGKKIQSSLRDGNLSFLPFAREDTGQNIRVSAVKTCSCSGFGPGHSFSS